MKATTAEQMHAAIQAKASANVEAGLATTHAFYQQARCSVKRGVSLAHAAAELAMSNYPLYKAYRSAALLEQIKPTHQFERDVYVAAMASDLEPEEAIALVKAKSPKLHADYLGWVQARARK